MAASTNLLLPYLEVGQLAKETTINTSLSYIDDALAGYATRSVAGGSDVTLSEAEARSMILRFTGLLTANIAVVVPTREQTHIITNDTTGAFTLTIKTVAGTGVAITQGTKALVYCDGTNVLAGPGGTGSGVTDGDKGDITVSSSGTVWTIDNDVVTYAKMQNVSVTDRILGRDTSGAGDIEELTLSAVLDFVGSAAQGDILYRGAATWTRLGAGTNGHYLQTQGAGANPQWAAATGVADGDKGDITVSSSGSVWTIDNDVVTYAKMQNVSATDRLLGRDTTGAGDVEELQLESTLRWTGTPGIGRAAISGDVDIPTGSNTATIVSASVTYAKIQNVTASRLLGRGSSGVGAPQEMTAGVGLLISGAVLSNALWTVEATTSGSGAPNVLAASESYKALTNEGSTARNYHTLPTAAAGLVFTFISQDADLMRVTADTGDTIRVGTNVSATAGYIENGAQGDAITLVAINATEWVAIATVGTWTPT
jgi:hypothetical protein